MSNDNAEREGRIRARRNEQYGNGFWDNALGSNADTNARNRGFNDEKLKIEREKEREKRRGKK